MRKVFATTVFFLFIAGNALAQYNLRDEHGDTLPTQWPPQYGSYDNHTITVWFNHNTINQNYLCNYWSQNDHLTKFKNPNDHTMGLLTGVMPIDTVLIINSSLVATLRGLGADSMQQYTNFSPCSDTLSITRFGDTIRTPEFWNSFIVRLSDTNAIQAVRILTLQYGGTAIDFAELNPVVSFDGGYVPVNPPNDPTWIGGNPSAEINFFPSQPPAPTQLYPYSEDIVGAWYIYPWPNIQHGDQSVKVGIIDDGFDYEHSDFGGTANNLGASIGCNTCSFKDGVDILNGVVTHPATHNGGGHGTPVAGLIGAITNNGQGVASIAGRLMSNGVVMPNTGVKLYGIEQDLASSTHANEVIFAAKDPGNGPVIKGFGVNVLNTSWGLFNFSDCNTPIYSEDLRRAFDYAYRMHVVCVASKGNCGDKRPHYPADYEYSKMIAVGAEGATWDPSKNAYEPTRCNSSVNNNTTGPCTSNWGYGIDIMAQGLNNTSLANNPLGIMTNQTLQDGGGTRWFSYTSAAAPQVAGVAALILSELNNPLANAHPNIQRSFYPEDVQGLLCATAKDMAFWDKDLNPPASDTIGYDAITGYGLLQGGAALKGMQQPYVLVHYTTTGGTVPQQPLRTLNPFIVMAPSDNSASLLPPTNANNAYIADQYPVTAAFALPTAYNAGPVAPNAAAWGIGDKSIGWNGSQPLDQNGNTVTYQTGYTRVIGYGMAAAANTFNPNDIRDIDFGAPLTSVTLQTYCYRIKDKNNNPVINPNYPNGDAVYPASNWFPCPPDKVVYNFSVWGVPASSVVEQTPTDLHMYSNKLTVYTSLIGTPGNQSVIVHYIMEHPEFASITVYDMLGRQIAEAKPNVWGTGEQTIILGMNASPSGAYIAIVRSTTAVGSSKFVLLK